MRKKVELKVKRPDGEIEIIDMLEKFPHMNQEIFDKIKTSTKEAGRGEVLECVCVDKKNNNESLVKQYNDLHNEGGEGYTPEGDYWCKQKNFKSWEETLVYK